MRDDMIYRDNLKSSHQAYIDKYDTLIDRVEAMKAQKYNTVDADAVQIDLTGSETETDSDSETDSEEYSECSEDSDIADM